MKEKEFIPILLGGDANVYGMARSFHEAYNIKSVVIGKRALSPLYGSKIIDFKQVDDFDKEEVFMRVLNDLPEMYKNKKLLLIVCGDGYLEMTSKNKAELEKNYIVPCVDIDIVNRLILKEEFYKTCEKYKFDYPKTFIVTKDNYEGVKLPFSFPVIIKPSNCVEYWKCSFSGKKKVFKAESEEEFYNILKAVYNSAYKDNLIVQDFIPGDDSHMRVLNCFSDKNGKVKMMSLGHVLLEEHSPQGIGSHAAIINDYDQDLLDKIRLFLEDIKYIGLSNFDIKYDDRDKKYKLFEINLRQGRSSYYVTWSGANLAKLLVEEFIYNKKSELKIVKDKHLWLIVPKQILFKYLKDENLKKEAKELIKKRKSCNSLFYKKDMNIKRFMGLLYNDILYFRKYKKYYNHKGFDVE